jgi:ectoine hydroxylase-related dioxygenase (phytanoyl-CoA dioxygenase family)
MSGPSQLSFEASGYAVLPDAIGARDCDSLAQQISSSTRSKAGTRTLLDNPSCAHLAGRLLRDGRLASFLATDSVVIQCTLFDKSPDKNWLVSLHQDLSIPVRHRIDDPECSGWSEKEGQVYVQPPVSVLEQLVAIRVHVDESTGENGPLRVVPGSHAFGRLHAERTEELRSARGEVVVPVPRGGALVMRPLVLHASSKATGSKPRRVLHFVFGPPQLPCGLEWRWAV